MGLSISHFLPQKKKQKKNPQMKEAYLIATNVLQKCLALLFLLCFQFWDVAQVAVIHKNI